MDQMTLVKIENERWNLENAIKEIQENLKELDNGTNMTRTSFIADLNSLISSAEELKTKLSLNDEKS